MKAALTMVELIKTLDARRGRHRKRVNVGQVNVQSGGQAIVGNVAHPNNEEPGSSKGEDGEEEAA